MAASPPPMPVTVTVRSPAACRHRRAALPAGSASPRVASRSDRTSLSRRATCTVTATSQSPLREAPLFSLRALFSPAPTRIRDCPTMSGRVPVGGAPGGRGAVFPPRHPISVPAIAPAKERTSTTREGVRMGKTLHPPRAAVKGGCAGPSLRHGAPPQPVHDRAAEPLLGAGLRQQQGEAGRVEPAQGREQARGRGGHL